MSVEIATKEDLRNFKIEILEQIKALIAKPRSSQSEIPSGTTNVRRFTGYLTKSPY